MPRTVLFHRCERAIHPIEWTDKKLVEIVDNAESKYAMETIDGLRKASEQLWCRITGETKGGV